MALYFDTNRRRTQIMKKACCIIIALLFAVASMAIGGERKDATGKSDARKVSVPSVRGDFVVFDVNQISTYIRNNGSFNRNPGTGNSGFEWPKGTGNTANYASGIWLGGSVSGDPRVAVAEYAYEYDAGPIQAGVNPGDNRWKVYKIRRGDTGDPTKATYNPDYADWPFDDGAPAVKSSDGVTDSLDGSGNRIPALTGDMTIWTVFNENNPLLHTNMNTAPLGVEVQLTAFAFNRSDALGNTIFYKWKLINKGGNTIDNAFVTVWTDIDLGDSGDDYDGCDTTLGLGYTYNADANDGVYGLTVPATGFDFLQGPLVPSPGDTARFPDGRIAPGKKFLKMTSFVKYNNDASDLGNPNTGQEVLNYMQGLTRSGLQITDDLGRPSTFMFWGDPNNAYDADTNWIETGAGGDRRFMMSAGPYTMAPGDTQEIVAANLIAKGSDYHKSVTALKNADALVQTAYDVNFKLPPPPPPPEVHSVGLDQSVILSWGENDGYTIGIETYNEVDPLAAAALIGDPTYDFEGYVVYQVANPSGDDPRMVSTYDVIVNPDNSAIPSPGKIFDEVFDSGVNDVIIKPVKFGTNSGIKRSIRITKDIYTNLTLANNKDYYFVVTSYGYSDSSRPRVLESSFNVVTVRPTKLPGERLSAGYNDTLAFAHAGSSEATFIPRVVDASKLTGHTYDVYVDTTGGSKRWVVKDVTADSVILASTNFGPSAGGNNYSYPIADGVQWFISDVETRPHPQRSQYSGDSVWLQGIRWENVPPAVIDPTDNAHGIITPSYDLPNFLGHMDPVFDPLNAVRTEVRFGPGETQKAYRMRRTGGVGTAYVIQATDPFVDVPFTVWDVGDTSSPRQLTVAWRDQDNSSTYNPPEDDDGVEIVFIYFRTYNAAGGQWPYQGSGPDPAAWSDVNTIGNDADIMYGMSLGLVAGHPFAETAGKLFVDPFRPLKFDDRYTVNTAGVAPVANGALAKADINNIMAVPNPYFGTNAYEQNQFGRVVRFTNLPPKAKIRIFNLAAELVKVIDKDDQSTTSDWDLTNRNDIPIASGMYVVHVDLPGIGQRILKVAVIMPEERLDNF